jgi:hypothetical protein
LEAAEVRLKPDDYERVVSPRAAIMPRVPERSPRVARWSRQFGPETTRKLLEWNQQPAPVYARKWQTDACYEALTRTLLGAWPLWVYSSGSIVARRTAGIGARPSRLMRRRRSPHSCKPAASRARPETASSLDQPRTRWDGTHRNPVSG